MTIPNSFENIFDQIADLIATIQNNRSKRKPGDKLPQNFHLQVEFIQAKMEFIRKITEEAIKRSGLDENVLNAQIKNPPPEMLRRDRKILKRANLLKKELEKVEQEVAIKKRMTKSGDGTQKVEGKRRRKKFKRLGGQDGWMPL